MRIPAAIWAPSLQPRVSNEWLHVSDVFPTLAAAAEIPLGDFINRLDGINQWPSLAQNSPGPRSEILHNIDDIFGYQVIMENGWKMVNGTTLAGKYDGFLGNFIEEPARLNSSYYVDLVLGSKVNRIIRRNFGSHLDAITVNEMQSQATVICPQAIGINECRALEKPCLFNLLDDPCEKDNLAESYPEIVERLTEKIEFARKTAELPRNRPSDPRADPRFFNNSWSYWLEEGGSAAISQDLLLWILIASGALIVAVLAVGSFWVLRAEFQYQKP